MPSRILREGILDSEQINALSDDAEIFYRRLMSVVDDAGRYEDNPAVIRARCFALKLDAWTLERVEAALAEVSQTDDRRTTVTRQTDDRHTTDGRQTDDRHTTDGRQTDDRRPLAALVSRYEVNGRKYIQINKFCQRIRHSKYPPPPNDGRTAVTRPSHDCQASDDRPPNSESESESKAQQQQAAAAAADPFEILDAVQVHFPTAGPADRWIVELAALRPEELPAVAVAIRRHPSTAAKTPVILVREAVASVLQNRRAKVAERPGPKPLDTVDAAGGLARRGDPAARRILQEYASTGPADAATLARQILAELDAKEVARR